MSLLTKRDKRSTITGKRSLERGRGSHLTQGVLAGGLEQQKPDEKDGWYVCG
jgi:hypothetical protein